MQLYVLAFKITNKNESRTMSNLHIIANQTVTETCRFIRTIPYNRNE